MRRSALYYALLVLEVVPVHASELQHLAHRHAHFVVHHQPGEFLAIYKYQPRASGLAPRDSISERWWVEDTVCQSRAGALLDRTQNGCVRFRCMRRRSPLSRSRTEEERL
jgi:hypothetical protein